ncbi:pilus assembly protein TadG-related protein [Sinirhodobacter sp. WL0062]|uniref:Pilus assembly protein TadG-related protein n=1 Tax=Rhodobacter flavimaris TaxID=2907145 RepID=A0ABS8YRW6_9RHOB|nr:Tad domain-containing protein [Sinirhodobacter sp. WL0062]MCE5972025.1 pilus assembly protein TadG-related protein [Sinirhodobacter sp. WL0062]
MPSVKHHISKFARDENGVIIVFWALCLVVVLGFVALSFDLGRYGITRTEYQAFADHVALSAAGELDGGTDAITRAHAAAALIADKQHFGIADKTLNGGSDYTLTFFTDLPASDAAAMTLQTTDATEAAYVRATVTPTTVLGTFVNAFSSLMGGGAMDGDIQASAVAGFSLYVCDVTPLMFCVPSGYKADANIGDMILLRSGGQGSAWGPGDFGFIDPSDLQVDEKGPCAGLNGQNLASCLIGAIGSITRCVKQKGIDTEPGQKQGIEDAVFNVRFDIYKSVMNGEKNDPAYAPAPNVIKGVVPNGAGQSCIGQNEQISPDTVALPRDDCFASGTCPYARIGNGIWANGREAYETKNYGTTNKYPNAVTRYDYYLAEIDASKAASGADILSGRAETGLPTCSNQTPAGPERRVIIAAGVDCTANPVSGAAVDVPVQEFFKIFLTEPVGDDGTSPPTVGIWGEIIGSASDGSGGGTGGLVRDVVQLYR